MVRRIGLIFLFCIALSFPFAARGDVAPAKNFAEKSAVPALPPVISNERFGFNVVPNAAKPGDTVFLEFSLLNREATSMAPSISVPIPQAMRVLEIEALPAGSSFDLQSRLLRWSPVLPANGSQQLRVPVRINVGDLTSPTKTLSADFILNNEVETYNTDYWVGLPPTQVAITTSPLIASVGQPIQLTATADGVGPFRQIWSLSDGRVLDTLDPTISFADVGDHRISVEITNPLGKVAAQTAVTIVDTPIAQFSIPSKVGAVDQPLIFANESGGKGVLNHLWRFGDGTESTEPNPAHVYQQTGDFIVTLTVSSDKGVSSTTQTVTIGEAPKVELNLETETGLNRPLNGALLLRAPATKITWEMGDGASYEDVGEVNHTYEEDGEYWVAVTIENSFGKAHSGKWITVTADTAYRLFLPYISAGETDLSQALKNPEPTTQQLNPEGNFAFDDATVAPANLTIPESLVWYINEARRIHGLDPLEYNYNLSVAAQYHSDDMAYNEFRGHEGSDGTSPYQRTLRFNYEGNFIDENTAWGFTESFGAVQFWINSPDHNPTILHPTASEVGIGYTYKADSPSAWYWVMEVGEN